MPTRKFRVLLVLISVPFTILALLIAVWASRTQLAEYSLVSVMHDAGINSVVAEIQQLDINHSVISRLEFTLPAASGLLHLTAFDTDIRYQPEKLKYGRIDQLVIDRLILRHENPGAKNAQAQQPSQTESDTAAQPLQPQRLITELQNALSKYLFFNTLEIRQINLHGKLFSVLQDKTFLLKSSTGDESLQAEIKLIDNSQAAQTAALPILEISKLSTDSLTIKAGLSAVKTTAPQKSTAGTLSLRIEQNTIDGSYNFHPERMQSWLKPFFSLNTDVELNNVDGTFFIDFKNTGQIHSTFNARTDKLHMDALHAEDIVLKIKLNNAALEPVRLTKIKNGSYLQAGKISLDDLLLKDSRIYLVGELATNDNSWNYNGGASWKKLSLIYQSQTLEFSDIAARIAANNETADASGYFSTSGIPGMFSFDLEHKLLKGTGTVSIETLEPLDLNAENASLSRLLTPWTYPFDLLSGNIKLSSKASWSQQDKFSLRIKAKLDDIGGSIKQHLFSGLSLNHELEVLPKLHTLGGSKLRLAHLDSGIIISNLTTAISLQETNTGTLPQISMNQLYGEILGGSFSTDKLRYDLNMNKTSFSITARNIDLAEIVKTQQLNDIVASGRIDGTLPVEISPDGVSIEKGLFTNNGRSGSIRYNPKAGTEQLKRNPLTGIALDALKDFRYSQLTAGINFTPEGTLSIDLKLKGISPQLDAKRPVHLNINTEQNLLSLLKSLRYAQGISENIDAKVRRQYESNQ